LDENNRFLSDIYKELESLSDTICLFVNFDLILKSKEDLIEFIQNIIAISEKNEIIITVEDKTEELEDIADYVSSISIKES
jgi:ATP:corrinoid adenosyltransferase